MQNFLHFPVFNLCKVWWLCPHQRQQRQPSKALIAIFPSPSFRVNLPEDSASLRRWGYRFPLFFAQRDDKEKEFDRSRFNPHSFLGAQVTQPIFNHHLQKKSHHISLKTALVQYWPSTSNGSATVPVILLKYNVNDKKLPSKGTTWDLKWQRQSYTLTKVWGALLLPCKGSIKKKTSIKRSGWPLGGGRGGHPPPAWPLLFCENFDPFCPL